MTLFAFSCTLERYCSIGTICADAGKKAATPKTRLARRTELDGLIAQWTGSLTIAAVEAALVAVGVPVHGVQNSTACGLDPQLRHRDHFRRIPHPVHGSCVVEGPRVQLSRTPGELRRAGPTLGEHNSEILVGLLGYSDHAVTELVIAGALG